MLRLIACFALLLFLTGCLSGASSGRAAGGAHEPHVQLWGPPDNSGIGSGGGGGGGGGM